MPELVTWLARAALFAGVGIGCGRAEPAACAPCARYAPAMPSGVIAAPLLDEISGLAASRRNPGVLFVHNDRSAPELFAVSEAGALLASFVYEGPRVQDLEDVEDIAVGGCPSGTCVFLADTGGNLSARTRYAIVRLAEPSVDVAAATLAAEVMTFTYPDGMSHDAEALLVAPDGEALYVIDKVAFGEASTVYRLPAVFGGSTTVVATKVATLPVPGPRDLPTTGADVHPCGLGIIVATGNAAYELRIAAGTPFEGVFTAAPVAVPVAVELQREGITYSIDGRGFFTTGEGSSEPINRTACQ